MSIDNHSRSFAAHKGVLLGFVFGAALGAFFDHISVGIAFCGGLGYLYDSGYFNRKKTAEKPEANPADSSSTGT